VLQSNLGRDGHLHKHEEDDCVPEDSDYEDESEPTENPTSGDREVDCEKEQEQELLPVLSVGSPDA